MIRPSERQKVILNMSLKERNYTGKAETMCPKDGWVLFKNSELLCGALGKLALGSGSKGSLFYIVIRDNSSVYSFLCSFWRLRSCRGFRSCLRGGSLTTG